jgi:hypothetical protein
MPFPSYLLPAIPARKGWVTGEERIKACGGATFATDAPASGGFVV